MRAFMPLLLVIAAIGLFIVFTDPTYQNVQNLRATYAQYDNSLTQSSQVRQLRDSLLARRNTFSTDDIRKLERLLPDNVDNIRLIIDINDVAARYHLQVSNVSLGTQTQTAGAVGSGATAVGSVDLTFTLSATYDQFIAFLQDLQRSLRLIEVEHIKFDTKNLGPNGATDYTVQIRTYWLR